MPAKTSLTKTATFLHWRQLGYPRSEAARRAGISYSTAQRIDRPEACPICQRVRDEMQQQEGER